MFILSKINKNYVQNNITLKSCLQKDRIKHQMVNKNVHQIKDKSMCMTNEGMKRHHFIFRTNTSQNRRPPDVSMAGPFQHLPGHPRASRTARGRNNSR